MPELTPEQKAQLDNNIKAMLNKGAGQDDVIKYANDFKAKYDVGVKKKEEVSIPSAREAAKQFAPKSDNMLSGADQQARQIAEQQANKNADYVQTVVPKKQAALKQQTLEANKTAPKEVFNAADYLKQDTEGEGKDAMKQAQDEANAVKEGLGGSDSKESALIKKAYVLKSYFGKRMDALNEQEKQIRAEQKNKQDELVMNNPNRGDLQGTVARPIDKLNLLNKQDPNDVAGELEVIQKKKADLSRAVDYYAKLAAHQLKPNGTNKELAQEYGNLVNDERLMQLKRLDNKNIPTSDEDKLSQEQLGLKVRESALEEKYNGIPIDQRPPEYFSEAYQINEGLKTAINRFPELKQKRVAQKIVQDLGNDAQVLMTAAGNGDKRAIKLIADKTGLSTHDINSVSTGDLPSEGAVSNIAKGIYDAGTGLVTGAHRLLGGAFNEDKDRIDYINQKIAESGDAIFGNNPYQHTQASPTIINQDLEEVRNPKAGKYSYNAASVKNFVGSAIGNLVGFIAGTKGLGALGLGERAALWTNVIGGSYENNYHQAGEILGKDATEGGKNLYALLSGAVQAAAFEFLPKEKLGLAKVDKSTAKELASLVKGGSIENVDKEVLKSTLQKALEGVAKSGGETAKVMAATKGAELVNAIVASVAGDKEGSKVGYEHLAEGLTPQKLGEEFAGLMIPLSLAEIPHTAKNSRNFKEMLFDSGLQPNESKAAIGKMVDEGKMSEEDAAKRNKVIDVMANIQKTLPDNNPTTGEPLTHNQQVEYAYNRVKELATQAKKEGVKGDVALSQFYDRNAKELVDERKSIIEGTHDEYLKRSEIFDRIKDKETHKAVVNQGTKSEVVKYLADQALTATDGTLNGLKKDTELTTDLIAQNSPIEIKDQIKVIKEKLSKENDKEGKDQTKISQLEREVDLLQQGLEKAKQPKAEEPLTIPEPPKVQGEPENISQPIELSTEATTPTVSGEESKYQQSANEIQRLRSEMSKSVKELDTQRDKELKEANKKGFKEGEFNEITKKYDQLLRETQKKYNEQIDSHSENVGGDTFLMKGDKNAKVGHHFTDESALNEILDTNEVIGYEKEDEGFGGVSLTTDKDLDNKGIVLNYGNSQIKNKTTNDQSVRIDFNIDKLKEDGYKTKLGNEDLGTFPNEQEIRIIKDDGSGIRNTSETTISDAKKYINNVQINEKLLGAEKTKELIKKLEETGIKYTVKSENKPTTQKEEVPIIDKDGNQKTAEDDIQQPAEVTSPANIEFNKEGGTTETGKQDKEGAAEPPKPPVEEPVSEEGGNKNGITHAAIAELRKIVGLSEYEGKEREGHDKLISEAQETIKNNPNAPNESLNKMENGGKVTNKDNAILAVYKATIDAEMERNPTKELLERATRLSKALDVAGTEAGKLLESRKLVGKEDNLTNFLLDKQSAQGTPLTETQMKSEAAKYEELKAAKEALEKQLIQEREQHAKDIAELGLNKAKAKAKRGSKKSNEDYKAERKDAVEAAREALKKLKSGEKGLMTDIPFRQQLSAIAPYVKKYLNSLASQGVDKLDNVITQIHAEFKDVLDGITKKDILNILAGEHDEAPKEQTKNQKLNTIRLLKREAELIKELERARKGEEAAKTEPKKIESNRRIDELKEKIKEVRRQNKENNGDDESPNDVSAGEIEFNQKEQKRLIEKASKLTQDIRDKKYLEEKEKPTAFKKSRKTQLLEDKVIDLENKIRHERSKDEYNKRGKVRKIFDKAMEVLGIRRLVQSAVDISVPFRQGATLLSPRQADVWAKGFMANLQSIFAPKKFDRIMHEIRNDPMYHDMIKDNVVFNDLGSADPNLHNEDFRKSFIYKIPIISEPLKASNRSADAFLNVARIELYKKLRDNLEKRGITRESDPKAFRHIGNWTMAMTGRGTMHSALEKPAMNAVLGNTFYGARLMASRFNLLNPVTYFDPRIPKEARYEAMKDMIAFTGTMMAVGTALAYTTGAKISLNPDDSDFLQLRYGDKVYDISGGLANYVRTGLRITKAAYTKASGTKYEGNKATENAGKSILNFFRNKLSPNTGFGVDAFFGGRYGQDFSPSDIYQIYPMYAPDAIKAWKEEGVTSLATVLLPNILGVGYGSYASKGQIDANLEDLLKRNLRSDEMNNEKIKNYNDGGRVVTKKEFDEFADKRDEEITKGLTKLYQDGAPVIDDNNEVKIVPYKDLTQEQVIKETNIIKAMATKKVKEELFGKNENSGEQKYLDKQVQRLREEMNPKE